jgi:histidine ammonia-lyase
MTVVLDGSGLSIEKLVSIARDCEKVELTPGAGERIRTCREMLEDKLRAREIMYGTNTGIGEFSEIVLDDEQVKQFQKFLIYNHAAGIGDPAPIEHIRAAMASRVNVHAHGNSACRPEITLTLVEMLNRGVTPVVCQKGSVGACGDLAPRPTTRENACQVILPWKGRASPSPGFRRAMGWRRSTAPICLRR